MAKRITTTKKFTSPDNGETSTAVLTQTRRPTPPSMARPTPTEDQIRVRAYEIYLRRKGGPGNPHADWLQAEAELKSEMSR